MAPAISVENGNPKLNESGSTGLSKALKILTSEPARHQFEA